MALLAAYSFDEVSGAVVDHSGNGRDFALTTELGRSAAGTGHGDVGRALTSVNATITGTMTVTPFGQSADRTVMCWLRGTGEVWHVEWPVNSINSGAWGLATLSGQVQVRARNAAGVNTAGVTMPTDGLWHHICGTYQESTGALRFYLDGVLAASTILTGPLRTDADSIQLGEWGAGTTLDDLRIYDQALDATAIADAMNTPVSGAGTVPGVIGGQMPALGGQLVGTVSAPGQIGGQMPQLGGQLAAAVAVPGVVGGLLPALGGQLVAAVVDPGIVGGLMPALGGQLVGAVGVPGVIGGLMPALGGQLFGVPPVPAGVMRPASRRGPAMAGVPAAGPTMRSR